MKSQQVTFNSVSTDSDGTITKTEWDLDANGTIDFTGNPYKRTSRTPGVFSVRVKVTDNSGAHRHGHPSDRDRWQQRPGGRASPPRRRTRVSGEEVKFTSTSTDSDGSVASLAWDLNNDGNFGDGSKVEMKKTFPLPGASGHQPEGCRR